MVVIVANNLPDKVRGALRCWFLEPKPNVFVSNVSRKIEDRVIEFLTPYMTEHSGLIIMRSNGSDLQGFDIRMHSAPNRSIKQLSGNQLLRLK